MLTNFHRPIPRIHLPIIAAKTAQPPKLLTPLKPGELVTCRRGPRAGLPKQPKRDRRRYLYPSDLLRIANAHDFAIAQGMEWGVFVTILRTHLPGSAAGDLPKVQERVFQSLRRYCQAQGLPNPEFIWVRECQHRKLDHLHVLTSIPDTHYKAVQAVVMRMGFSAGGVVAKRSGDPYKLLRYFAKQLDPDLSLYDGADSFRLRDFIGLRERPDDLPLSARRSGTSQGVGRTAQAQAGFKPMRTVDDLCDFYSGQRDNEKTAKRRGWNAGAPDRANSFDYLKRAHLIAANDNAEEALSDAA